MPKRYWLMKSEPDVFSFDDLAKSPKKTTHWEGVRNFQARNNMKEMKKGDEVFFYHSNANPSAVVGTATVVREAYPDDDQFDRKSRYYDATSRRERPKWVRVDIRCGRPLERPVSLPEIRETKSLADMVLVKRSRLSVQPVTEKEWKTILKMGGLAT